MVTHAFFKALLFLSVGNLIHLRDSYQDLRTIGLRPSNTPTRWVITLANIRLVGIPFTRGFVSKD